MKRLDFGSKAPERQVYAPGPGARTTKRVVLAPVPRPEGLGGPICTMDHNGLSRRAQAAWGDGNGGGDPTRARRGALKAVRVA